MKKMKNEKMKNRFDNDSPNKAFFLTDHFSIRSNADAPQTAPPLHLRCFNPHFEGLNYIELKKDFYTATVCSN